MSTPEKGTLTKCTVCGRETDVTDAHCPSCGERLIKKLNPVILSQEDYEAIRSSNDYWKCTYCGAINYHTYTTCQNCSAVRKEAPRKGESSKWGEERREKSERTSITDSISTGLSDLASNGVEFFKGLPRNYKLIIFGILLVALGALPVWNALSLNTVGSVLLLVGLGLILVTGGFFKKKDKGAS